MRYVVMFRSTLRFMRCVADPTRIAEFETYAEAEGAALPYGLDASILEIGRRVTRH